MRSIILKAIKNKKNGQVNFSLPKRKLPLVLKNKLKLSDKPKFKIKIEEIL